MKIWIRYLLQTFYQCINFFETCTNFTANTYKKLRSNIFENEIIHYEMYNRSLGKFTKLYDYDNLWHIFLFSFFFNKNNYLVHVDSLKNNKDIVICSFVKNGIIHRIITDYTFDMNKYALSYEQYKKTEIVYALANDTDVIHILEDFKISLLLNESMNTETFINALLHFYGFRSLNDISLIIMTDLDYEEKRFKHHDILKLT